jgi:hypothetical protein
MELAQGDTLLLGNSRIRLERKSGQRARLMIDSTLDIDRIKAGERVPEPDADGDADDGKPARAPTPPKPPMPFLKRPNPPAAH